MSRLASLRRHSKGQFLWASLGSLLVLVGCTSADSQDDNSASAASMSVAGDPSDRKGVAAGEAALKEGKYQEAVKRFTAAIADNARADVTDAVEGEAEVYYQRGVAYMKLGFPDTAAQDFTAAINLAPNNGRAYEQRAEAYVGLGDAYKALRDATQAIRLMPENATAYRIRGGVYLGRGEYQRAVADLEQALADDSTLGKTVRPQLARAYAQWSQASVDAGDAATAEEKLAKARSLDPAVQSEVVVEVAESLPPESIEQTVAKPVIDEADRRFTEARDAQLKQAHDQALIGYTEAVALRHDFGEAYLRRGETLLAMGFPDSAIEDFKAAASYGKPTAEAWGLEAQAHMMMKNPHRAAMSATNSLHENPTNAAAYALRGEAYFQMEDWDRAVADLEEAIRRSPERRDALEEKLAAARSAAAEVQPASAASEL